MQEKEDARDASCGCGGGAVRCGAVRWRCGWCGMIMTTRRRLRAAAINSIGVSIYTISNLAFCLGLAQLSSARLGLDQL